MAGTRATKAGVTLPVTFALTGLGLVLASAFLGRRSLWLDEAASVGLARSSWAVFVKTVTSRETNQGLYFLMLRGWVALGRGEATVRAMSVLIGVATIPFVVLLGGRLFGRRAGVLAGLLLAVNVVWVHFAQEARGYGLCLLLLVAGTWLLVRAVQDGGTTIWLAYGIVIALAAYAHFFAFFVLAAHACSLVFLPRDRIPWRGVATGGLVALAGVAPLIVYLRSASSQGIGWVATTGGGHLISRVQSLIPRPAGLALTGIALLAAAFAVPRIQRALPHDDPVRWWGVAVIVLWLAVPIIGALALSYFSTPVLVARYFSVILPPALLLLAGGLALLRMRSLVAALMLVGVVSAVLLVRWYAHGESQDWRSATHYVAGSARQGDAAVFFAPYMRIPFDYYLERSGPASAERRLDPVFPDKGWAASSSDLGRFTPVDARRVDRRLAGHPSAWLIESNGEIGGRSDPELVTLRKLLSGRYARVRERRFTGIVVQHFDQPLGVSPTPRS